jgi:hypothetical protein
VKISKQRLKEIAQEEFIGEAYYGSIPGEPETPAGYGGAVASAKVQQHLSDEIDDLVRLGKLNLDDLSVETVRANQEVPWDKFQAIDDEVLEDIIHDYQRRRKFYNEGRLVGRGVAKDITNTMNSLASMLTSFDPKSLEGRGGRSDETSEDLRAAWFALQSSFDQVFGDSLENTIAPTSTPLEEACGGVAAMTDEPMPMPGPPPEGGGVMEPAFDDHEGRMAKSQLSKLVKDSNDLVSMLGDKDQLPSWVQAKVTKAADYLGAVKQYLEYERLGAAPMHEGKLARGRLMKLAGIKIL